MTITPMLITHRSPATTLIMGWIIIRTTRGTVIMAERTPQNIELAKFSSFGAVSQTIWIADAHRDDRQRFV
jgi:hypothetical protein